MKNFVLKKTFSVMAFLSISTCSSAITLVDFNLNIDQEISRLNRQLSDKMVEFIDIYESLPDLPEHFLVNGKRNNKFYMQAPKVLNLIDFLVENRNEPGFIECLNDIIKIFYYQSHKFIDGFSFEGFVDPNLSKEQRELEQFDLKRKLLSILYGMYCGESTETCGFSYLYDSVPLALNATKGMIGIFGTKSNTSLESHQRIRSLLMQFLVVKSQLSDCLCRMEKKDVFGTSSCFPTHDEVKWFMDNLQRGVIISEKHSTLGSRLSRFFGGVGSIIDSSAFKYTLIIAILACGAIGAVKMCQLLGKSAEDIGGGLEKFGSLNAVVDRILGKAELFTPDGKALNPVIVEQLSHIAARNQEHIADNIGGAVGGSIKDYGWSFVPFVGGKKKKK